MIWCGTAAQNAVTRRAWTVTRWPPIKIRERAPIEKIDLDFVVPIGPRHLPRLPDFAGKAVRREIAPPAVEMVHHLGFGRNHGLSIVSK